MRTKITAKEDFRILEKVVKRYRFNLVDDDVDDDEHKIKRLASGYSAGSSGRIPIEASKSSSEDSDNENNNEADNHNSKKMKLEKKNKETAAAAAALLSPIIELNEEDNDDDSDFVDEDITNSAITN